MSNRNINLDALRAVAIFMVMAHHFNYGEFWTRAGWAGVDLFFVLSGFLISGLLFGSYQKSGDIDIRRFYIRRGFKIWPAFYAMIATGVLIDASMKGHSVSLKRLLSELFFVQSYFPGLWVHTWSLAVEEHFYLLLPLLLLAIRGSDKKPFFSLPYIFSIIAVLGLACRFAVGWGVDTDSPTLFLFPTHLRIDGLMFGVLLSYYRYFQPALFGRIAAWKPGWLLVAGAVALLAVVPNSNHHMHTWGFTVLYLAAGFLVVKSCASDGPKAVRLIAGWLARVGFYSYSIYLWHMFVLWRVMSHFHFPSRHLEFWTYVAACVGLGILMAKIIEMPVLRFRDRVFPSGSTVRPAATWVENAEPVTQALP